MWHSQSAPHRVAPRRSAIALKETSLAGIGCQFSPKLTGNKAKTFTQTGRVKTWKHVE